MKSKNTKIQKILKKGILAFAVGVMLSSPLAYAATSLDDSYLEGSLLDQLLYGKIGSTAKEIEEYFTKNPNKPLYITNETQLRAFAEFVNKGENSESGTEIYSCIGKEIILLNDIEIDRTNKWVPIGGTNLDKNNFRGTFDGRGHTIKGLAFTDDEYSYKYVGLFGIIGKGGTVKNLTTEDFNIRIDYNIDEIEGNSIYTTAAGNIAGACYGTIENCVNKSSIYGPRNVGGIVGYLANNYGNAKIIKTTNTGAVTGYKNVAGIVAYTNGNNIELINCKNTGQIAGKNIIGGIIGLESGEEIKIENCVNKGRISGDTTGERIGGIVAETGNAGDGNQSDLTIENCINEGELNGSKYIGGIVGLEYAEEATIENCINKGKIKGTDYDIGGIVGYSQLDLILKECLNKGQVSGNGNHIGGIVGKAEGANIQLSINDANVRGYNYVGGIVGYATDNTIIEKCHKKESSSTDVTDINTYEIIGVTYVGGIAGCLDENSTISYCSNTSEVIGVDGSIGGIAGIVSSSIIENSASIADILSDYKHITYGSTNKYENTKNPVIKQLSDVIGRHVGGIAGYAKNVVEISNCYVGRRVEGYDYVGGFVGYNDGTVQYSNNYLVLNEIENFNMDTVQVIANNSKAFLNLKSGKYSCGLNKDEVKYLGLMDHTITTEYTYSNIKKSYQDEKIEIANTGGGNSKNENAYIETNFNNMVLTRNGDYIGANLETNQENSVVIDSGKGLVATFNVPEGYYKAGDTIEIGVTFNKKLYTSLGTSNTSINKDTAPKLTMKIDDKIIELDKSSVSINGNTTIVNYTKKITEDIANGKVAQLNIENSTKYWAIEGNIPTDATTYTNYEISSINKTLNLASGNIVIDTIKPIITTKVYVDNMLETDRYTAGKEIKFEVKTNERIQGIYTAPEIKVSFSGSGIGKYNYSKEKGEGFAKCTEAKINVDSTTTWKYSYQIQERDEGKLEFTFTAGNIKDLAGNETDIAALYRPTAPVSSKPIVGTEWSEDLAVTYEFYKNSVSESNRIVGQTYFTGEDDLIVVATYDKVLYVVYANVNKEDKSIPFSSTYLNNLPSLYLNADGNLKSKATSMSTTKQIEDNKQIEVTYKFENIAKNEYLDELTLLSKVALKNENNTTTIQAGGGDYVLGGQILYSTEYYDEYKDEYKDNLHIIQEDEIKTTEGLDDIIIDPIGVSQKIEKSDIYADTTAPTVKITTNKTNPTNANEILYTFEFNEVVEGFEASDITVNNGEKVTEKVIVDEEEIEEPVFEVIEEGKKYTLLVKPTITDGNEGILQVMVEEGACTDLVAINNVRQENNITIDKVRPTFTSYEINQEEEKVILDLTFSEALSDVSELKATLMIGGNNYRGTWEDAEIYDNNKVKLVYNVSTADGGKVELTLDGTVKDTAGNDSEKLKIQVENDITLEQTVIINGNGNDKYTFVKNETPIFDFTVPTYFVADDVITVGRLTEVEDEDGNTTEDIKQYSYVVVGDIDRTHITYMTLTEAAEGETVGTVTFGTSGSIDISEANIWFDTVAPKVITEIIANNPKDEVYTTGEEFTINATTTEVITDEYVIPEIGIKFGDNAGKFNNGKVQFVETIKNENGTTTWVYRYVVSVGDEGEVSLSYVNGSIKDLAGNSTTLTSLNTEENIFVLNEITVDATAPTVTISVKKVEEATKTDVENNITNADKLEYTFTWSEEVTGFTDKDVTVNNGTKGELKPSETDTKVYTMLVDTNVEEGNSGNIQVIIEQNACQDQIGLNNVRTESVIRVDKIAPIFVSLEGYVENNAASIDLSSKIDPVKQYYKAGEKVIIVATFSENINNSIAPKLNLQFSESGNAKGSVTPGVKDGNKITYTYTITNDDMGILSVKGFSGEVVDTAGNKTTVTKRVLDGDTIIADTKVPNLLELKVTSSKKANKSGDRITIEAVYDEEIYALITKEDGKKEVVNITNENAPKLDISFGGVAAKGEMTASYGEDRKTIVYTYIVKGEEAEGDNGALVINKLENIATSEVCDIAGNTSENTTSNKTTNEVYADTKKPVVDSITAKIDENTDQFIKDTNIYHKAGNKIDITVKFSEDVHTAKLEETRILVGFSEDKEKEPSIYKPVLDLNGTTAERTYSYIIQDGDNGYLWVKVENGHYADEAGNENSVATRRITDNEIYADTIVPTLTIYKDISTTQNGQTITVDATFSENIYNLEGKTLKGFSSNSEKEAPIIIYGFAGATGNLEENASTVKGNVITYVITKENTISGEFYHAYFRGNVYDRAGNACLTNDNLDTIAPVLKNIEVSSNAGTYHPYCKEGTEIYVTATFDEPITSENIKLEAKVGENEIDDLDGQIVTENPKQVRFTYEVQKNDMDEFTILDICGELATEDKEDYGWVEDKHGNRRRIYNLEGINPTGKAIADTENPSIKSVKAIINGKDEVATYPKEEGKDETARVNVNDIEYVVTFTELIKVINESEIKLYNGEKVEIINNDSDEDGYYDQITIKARTTIEGVQSLIIGDNVIEDRAGNKNALERFNMVTTDFTKPTVRFISEYNGGIYVLPTNVEKIEIRPNVEISEDIAKIYYKWKELKDGEWEDIEPYAEVGNYTSASDIAIDTQTFGEGSYKLYIKVVDLAGNEYETKEGIEYKIVKSSIGITPNITSDTNQDVIVNITFREGLTDNKKVVFKPVGSNEIQELRINDEGKYIVDKDLNGNGTIYVEATDKIGNKVYEELSITNIDTELPNIKIKLNSADLIIGTGETNATIKTDVELNDNMTNYPEGKYVFLQGDINLSNMTEEQKVELKAKMVNELHGEAKIENAVSTKDKQPYYLYVLAKDKAGNEKISKAGPFTVVDTNEKTVTNDAGEESKIPAEIEINKLISFEQKGKYVDISYNNFSENEDNLNIIREKEIFLTNIRDGYIDYENFEHVEVNGATTITVVGKDACGNKVTATHEVTKDSIEGPEFDVIGNPENWTNQDVKLEISCYEELTALTVNGKDILSRETGVRSSTVVTQNGDYEFIAIDTYGNVSKKTITVSKIDKDTPEISKVEDKGRDIIITATDIINEVEGSGIVEYAISKTTEIPAEWSESNVIKVTEDGTFYAWVKDRAGNIGIASTEDEDGKVTITEIKVDTTAPVITLNYLSQTITVGMPIEANVFTNEDAIISYSWDKENWIDSEELITSLKVSQKSTTIGIYTLYAKAEDNNGNVSKVVTLEFNVVNMEEIRQPDIIFEDIPTVLIDGVRYIKVSSEMTVVGLTEKMNKVALCGKKPEFIKLTAEEDLKTGSEITLNGVTKYIIVIEGDMNCDGKVTFDDIVKTNAVRISSNEANITKAQLLAVDINNTAKVEFKDIISINAIRINSSK